MRIRRGSESTRNLQSCSSAQYRHNEGQNFSSADSNPVGRPALDKDKGPMNEDELRERKRQLGKSEYKRSKISQVRREAALLRKDRVSEIIEEEESNVAKT